MQILQEIKKLSLRNEGGLVMTFNFSEKGFITDDSCVGHMLAMAPCSVTGICILLALSDRKA